jgi:RTX calcium-binding nonapeptide repeat (4 copies)
VWCAVLLVGVDLRAEASQEEQERTAATEEQAHPDGAAPEEGGCEGTQTIVRDGAGYLTNDVPGCPKGGPLSDTGTGCGCALDGMKGDDEVRGGSTGDHLTGGIGSDVVHGGPGNDELKGGNPSLDPSYTDRSKDMLYGGPGRDVLDGGVGDDVLYGGEGDDFTPGPGPPAFPRGLSGGRGKDVLYGGDGNDLLNGGSGPIADHQRDELYCEEDEDHYIADKLDYVDSSCEVNDPLSNLRARPR